MQKKIYISFFSLLFALFLSMYAASPASAAPPAISSINTVTALYAVTFTWNTSVPADSWVDFDVDGSRYVLKDGVFTLRFPSTYVFSEFRDSSTGQMVGRCDGEGEVTNHCVKLLAPAPGKVYPFRIKSCSGSTNCSLSDVSSFKSALDTSPPTRPTNFLINPSGGVASDQINLIWVASYDNAPRYFPGYKIYRNNTLIKTIDPVRYIPPTTINLTQSFTPLVDSSSNRDININVSIDTNILGPQNYIDLDVSPDTTYIYYVTAFDLGGNESLPSVAIERHTPAVCPPGYIEIAIENPQETPIPGTNAAPNCVVNGSVIPPETPPSGVSGIPVVTSVQTNISTPYAVTFRWSTSIPSDSWIDMDINETRYVRRDNKYILVDSRFMEFRDSKTNQMIGRCDGGGKVNNHCVTLVTPVPGKMYPYRIRSCDGAKCGITDILSFTSALDTTRPTRPIDLTTNVTGADGVQLTWSPSRDNAPRYFPGYKIYKNGVLIKILDPLRYTVAEGDLNVNVPIALNDAKVQYVDFDVTPQVTYTYYVTAIDIGGNESSPSDSNSIQCIQGATLLCAPTLIRTLQLGITGEDVKTLQRLLIAEKVYPAAIVSGYFGPLTTQAVILFQEKYRNEVLIPLGLTQGTGIVGPATRAKINTILLSNLG